MTKQFIEFERQVRQAGGKISSTMFISLTKNKSVDKMHCMPPKMKLDATLYTDKDGKVDEDRKLYCTEVQTNAIKYCAKDHCKFQEDWMRMFHHIRGELCAEMTARL